MAIPAIQKHISRIVDNWERLGTKWKLPWGSPGTSIISTIISSISNKNTMDTSLFKPELVYMSGGIKLPVGETVQIFDKYNIIHRQHNVLPISVSMACLADFFISFITVDKVVYSFITKKELFTKKMTFQNEGLNTFMDLLCIFFTAFKLYRVQELIPWERTRKFIHLVVLFCLIISACLFTVRLAYYFIYNEWIKGLFFNLYYYLVYEKRHSF